VFNRQDFGDAWKAARATFTWPLFFTLIAIALVVGGLFWLGGHADPRYRASCSEPGDLGFLLFFLSIPVVGICGMVGLGEGVQWGRLRPKYPQRAGAHLRRSAVLLGVAFAACIAAAIGLLGLCHLI